MIKGDRIFTDKHFTKLFIPGTHITQIKHETLTTVKGRSPHD